MNDLDDLNRDREIVTDRSHLLLFLSLRPNGFLGLSLHDRTILFLVVLLDQTVSVR